MNLENKRVFAIITAGGKGERMGFDIPKQFMEVNKEFIFLTTIKKFIREDVYKIILVIKREWRDFAYDCLRENNISQYVEFVYGGETADESRYNALCYLRNNYDCDKDIVIFHDSVRPNVIDDNITTCIDLCKKYNSAIVPIISCKDSVSLLIDEKMKYVDNKNMVRLQTPQAFIFNHIYNAYKTILENDDKWLGTPIFNYLRLFDGVITFDGDEINFKITTKDDLELYKKIKE